MIACIHLFSLCYACVHSSIYSLYVMIVCIHLFILSVMLACIHLFILSMLCLRAFIFLLTLSAHAREGYSSHFVCVSVCLCVTF